MRMQTTLARAVEVSGIALHSGVRARARLSPAPIDTGIVFIIDGVEIPATVAHVVDTQLATTLGREGVRVRTVEHLLATLMGLGLDNLMIEVEGGELPVLDGCGAAWSEHLHGAGIVDQAAPIRIRKITRAVEVRDGPRWARLEPADGLVLDVSIDFEHPCVGRQTLALQIDQGVFDSELAWARTFGFERHVPAMKRMGLVLGGTLDNALVFGEEGPLNEGGVRRADEPVRHKMLDALGDMALLGGPVHGRLVAERPGHGVIFELMSAVVAQPDSWKLCGVDA